MVERRRPTSRGETVQKNLLKKEKSKRVSKSHFRQRPGDVYDVMNNRWLRDISG